MRLENNLILIVDDTPTNLQVICETLEDAGFEIATALSGTEAIEQIGYQIPDLILLDVMMPGIDGFETCRKLKEDIKFCDIPIIFMTALSDTEHKIKGLNLGAVDYITKPFQEIEVLARVKNHLKLKKLTQNLAEEVEQKTEKLTQTMEELKNSQLQLIQREKMSALGELVAGIAHEINNPLGFISGNLGHAEEYMKVLIQHLQLYRQTFPNPGNAIAEDAEDIDLEFVLDDFPKTFASLNIGVKRIQELSKAMRLFSRVDRDRAIQFDIHKAIDSTLTILNHRFKPQDRFPGIEILKNYQKLPHFEGKPGQIGQVFMNIFANAVDAIEEDFEARDRSHKDYKILISTLQKEKNIIICIKDNGIGIPEEIATKIFTNNFTTKSIDKGTGLGLSISRQIIVDKHGGTIDFTSVRHEGTEFIIELPQQ